MITMPREIDDKYDVQVKSENNVIQKQVLHAGPWGSRPLENAKVKVTICEITCTGVTLKCIQESNSVSQYLSASFDGFITIGNADCVIDKSLELCIQSMLVGEISKFLIKLPSITNPKQEECSSYPYVVECCMKLEELSNDIPICDWPDDKIYNIALHHKTEGVKLFNSGRKIESFLRFSKSFKFLNIINTKSEKHENTSAFQSLRVALLNNMANCQLEFQNDMHAIVLCGKVLQTDPNNVKSLYRRAMAYVNTKKFEEAKDDLQKILQIEPSNAIAKEKYCELKVIMKEKDANYAAVIKKMFSS